MEMIHINLVIFLSGKFNIQKGLEMCLKTKINILNLQRTDKLIWEALKS